MTGKTLFQLLGLLVVLSVHVYAVYETLDAICELLGK
jgi:hypothetical protein